MTLRSHCRHPTRNPVAGGLHVPAVMLDATPSSSYPSAGQANSNDARRFRWCT